MTLLTKFLLLTVAALVPLGILTACSPLTTLNAITPAQSYVKSADIAYGAEPRQKLDIYAPTNKKAPGLAPVVVFFYGGNWNSGRRTDYAFVGEALASRGILTVVADYRLYPQVRYPAFLEDSARAVAWAAKEIRRYGGDSSRLFVMGHSAGAYNAAMVALDGRWLKKEGMAPENLRGWIGLAGPYDFIPIVNEDTKPVFFHPNTPLESQPIVHVSRAAPPALLIAPENDSLVNPVRNTGGLSKKLRDAEVKVRELYFGRVSHPLLVGAFSWPLRSLAPVLDEVENFVVLHSK